eukprot:CAMPEP_0176294660 /NCGR_PEP_ID=MMETSP0121_2-20121125/57255_1 /TAXON_ID=160619 /ORGANISM="Kryptoperidinium foliaceum, Strain CCMP 1326" /LENGTH=54 /DNA_ID=CAMNT_0017635693 /DNA_START=214 /DNA_END=375 /DNA_ORIENTATION=+
MKNAPQHAARRSSTLSSIKPWNTAPVPGPALHGRRQVGQLDDDCNHLLMHVRQK